MFGRYRPHARRNVIHTIQLRQNKNRPAFTEQSVQLYRRVSKPIPYNKFIHASEQKRSRVSVYIGAEYLFVWEKQDAEHNFTCAFELVVLSVCSTEGQ